MTAPLTPPASGTARTDANNKFFCLAADSCQSQCENCADIQLNKVGKNYDTPVSNAAEMAFTEWHYQILHGSGESRKHALVNPVLDGFAVARQLERELQAAESRAASDAKDARRYRWLRSNLGKQPHAISVTKYRDGWDKPVDADLLDAAIDAASGEAG